VGGSVFEGEKNSRGGQIARRESYPDYPEKGGLAVREKKKKKRFI